MIRLSRYGFRIKTLRNKPIVISNRKLNMKRSLIYKIYKKVSGESSYLEPWRDSIVKLNSNKEINNISFKNDSFKNIEFEDVKFKNINFNNSSLTKVFFKNVKLKNTSFINCDLTGGRLVVRNRWRIN